MPWLSPRTPMSVRWPSPNAVEVAPQLAAAELVGGQTVPMFEDLRDDAGHGQPEQAVVEPVADRPAPSRRSSGGTRTRVRGVTLPASSRALTVSAFSTEPGSKTSLMAREPRSSLREAQRVAGVEGGVVGEGQDLAGLGVHDHGEAGVGAGVLDGLAQDALGVPLQVEVDRGLQVLAVDRLDDGALAERDPVAAADGVPSPTRRCRRAACRRCARSRPAPRRCR